VLLAKAHAPRTAGIMLSKASGDLAQTLRLRISVHSVQPTSFAGGTAELKPIFPGVADNNIVRPAQDCIS